MGWSGGSSLLVGVARIVDIYLPNEDAAMDVYARLIDLFEDHDCDTIDECEGRGPKYLDLAVEQWRAQFEEEWDDDE
jgi:hypothetical protein